MFHSINISIKVTLMISTLGQIFYLIFILFCGILYFVIQIFPFVQKYM